MSTRLATGGRLLNRGRAVEFHLQRQAPDRGFEGDTLASALLANGQTLVGRSFKYHRPRGIVASGAEEPNALVNLGKGGRFEPNQRATTTELFEGLAATTQNHWPSLEFDVGVLNNYVARLLPAGFYYKTFMCTPRRLEACVRADHPPLRRPWQSPQGPRRRPLRAFPYSCRYPGRRRRHRRSASRADGRCRRGRACCWSSRPRIGAVARL